MRTFLIVGSFVWMLLHIYVGFRTIEKSYIKRHYKSMLWSVLIVNGLAFISVMFLRYLPITGTWYEIYKYYGYIWCGIFVMTLVFVVLRDIIYLLFKLYARANHHFFNGDSPEVLEDPAKRRLFAGTVSASIFGTTTLSSAVGFYQATRIPPLKYVDVPLKNLPPELDGFTIVQLSDIHVGLTIKGEFLEAVVQRANTVDADMIALTGDFVDGYVPNLRDQTRHLADLKSRYGLFYCTGNHEYYWDGPGWCEEVKRLGGNVLVDAHTTIEHRGKTILIAGVADYSMKRKKLVPGHDSSPTKAINGAPPHDLSVLLAHQPSSIWEASEAGYDLQLSGHTHGGQFWPWNYIVGLAHPLSAGLGTFGKTTLYVSRGTGFWGPPNRFMIPSEITVLKLRRT